ncbi:MAG TPA: sensor histidine kinase [Anaerolineae bacterium]|nr:sensor histidine kinase [Anaerolineae bacterium]
MGAIRQFVALNSDIILFVYGLTFFTLGLAIAFQSRHYSRLDLARSLSWLAAFGILHGLYEWGELFSPVQEAYLSVAGIKILHSLHLIFLASSYACLFEFGASLLRPLDRGRWLQRMAAILCVSWALLAFVVLPRVIVDFPVWHNTSEALAGYFIGFPGGLLAAYGLRQQTFKRIAPLNVPHIVSMLRVAGFALIAYAIFGGLIPPPVPFFPGNVLNTATFEEVTGIPPEIIRSIIGLVLAYTFIRALEIFDVETARRIEAMEQQQILAAERDRIARDLHDGVIQKVYTAGLLIDSAQKQAAPQSAIADRLATAVGVLNDAISDLRRNIGKLHTVTTDESLVLALRHLAEDPRFQSMVDVRLDLNLPESDRLSPDRTEHVLAIVTEALSNVVRHARARQVALHAERVDGRLLLSIQDDGIGLPPDAIEGHGLHNMHDRARLLNGQIAITGQNGKGTLMQLDIPWKDER